MFYVWAVVNPDGTPVVDSIDAEASSAIEKFLRTGLGNSDLDHDWEGWLQRGYRCERFALTKENGLER